MGSGIFGQDDEAMGKSGELEGRHNLRGEVDLRVVLDEDRCNRIREGDRMPKRGNADVQRSSDSSRSSRQAFGPTTTPIPGHWVMRLPRPLDRLNLLVLLRVTQGSPNPMSGSIAIHGRLRCAAYRARSVRLVNAVTALPDG